MKPYWKHTFLVTIFIGGLISSALFAAGFQYEYAVVTTSQGERIRVQLADTSAKRQLGLGGRASLAKGEGMLFIFAKQTPHGFWMKGMHFPIDILWLKNRKVMHIESNVLPPQPGESLKTITPSVASNFVLELPAGASKTLGIHKGSYLKISF